MGITQIRGFQIANDAIDSDKIVNDTLTSADIKDGAIVDADISPIAAIVDSKLGTIQTPGKVLNAATSATPSNVINTIVSRDSNGDFSANVISGSINGKFNTPVDISLSGDVTGSVSFDGSQNVDIDVTISSDVVTLDAFGKISQSALPSIDGGSA